MNDKFKKNLEILEENDIRVCGKGPVWEDKPNSVELETYTDAGEDMIITLDEPSKKELTKYCEKFDINETVVLWWKNGENAAREKGVPFNNIKDHYNDYETFINKLREIAKLLD